MLFRSKNFFLKKLPLISKFRANSLFFFFLFSEKENRRIRTLDMISHRGSKIEKKHSIKEEEEEGRGNGSGSSRVKSYEKWWPLMDVRGFPFIARFRFHQRCNDRTIHFSRIHFENVPWSRVSDSDEKKKKLSSMISISFAISWYNNR